ncbi:glycosyltransferase family 2 protein [Mucilaginibacter lacusdianchii]|uniref:glycosyltransferase family 2 protein n=1 Tax=Mucilaginibacter lacusdianchii TaxID=2684211 RepID=UPI00131EAAD2|nr:glycosyltransferase family A protein [Mucilaginibacter sp. JXJ CY 39]
MNPIVSVIIPFYNASETIMEAVESVWLYPNKEVYEIIIINDGSTQPEATLLLEKLGQDGCRVIHQENKGQAVARNVGLKAAKGRYILFLDSDNKIRPDYIIKGIAALDANQDIGVIYGKPIFFGATTKPRFVTAAFDLNKLLAGNYIDLCAIVRKKAIDEIGGFDEHPEVGHEDYDLWIRIVKAGWKMHFIDSELFYYRINNTSHSSEFQQQERYLRMMTYLMSKHADLYLQCYRKLYKDNVRYRKNPFKALWDGLKH